MTPPTMRVLRPQLLWCTGCCCPFLFMYSMRLNVSHITAARPWTCLYRCQCRRESQASVIAVSHDDAAHHARAEAPAGLVHGLLLAVLV